MHTGARRGRAQRRRQQDWSRQGIVLIAPRSAALKLLANALLTMSRYLLSQLLVDLRVLQSLWRFTIFATAGQSLRLFPVDICTARALHVPAI
jgi:hypothetical protein